MTQPTAETAYQAIDPPKRLLESQRSCDQGRNVGGETLGVLHPHARRGRVGQRLPGSARRKSLSARTLRPPPRVGAESGACHRGMHRLWSIDGSRSRGTDSRRGIAAIDFRRSVSACSAGQPPSATPTPRIPRAIVSAVGRTWGPPSGGPTSVIRLRVRRAGSAQRTRRARETCPHARHGRVGQRLPGYARRKSLSARTLRPPPRVGAESGACHRGMHRR